jgi:glycosyltransferase involved in cell wall biosynthesis
MRTSIIIPTYNHGRYLSEAIESAERQTVPVEVVVVDDGSTDDTESIFEMYREPRGPMLPGNVVLIRTEHQGVAAARNAGLAASTGDYVMYLDADDLLDPRKVERQVRALEDAPSVGWVYCDVVLEDHPPRARVRRLASELYDYRHRKLDGWVDLSKENFIPNMAPLYRRWVALAAAPFIDVPTEDWAYLRRAATTECGYIPEVLATYRRGLGGRNGGPQGRHASRRRIPAHEAPLRLNLGAGDHPLPGLVNLDEVSGWSYQSGLKDFPDGSVAGVTVSHMLAHVPEPDWFRGLLEILRVLRPGGVLRVAEFDADRYTGPPLPTRVTPAWVAERLRRAGFKPKHVDARTSSFSDSSLMQSWHGEGEFFIEGVKR